jgi:hypothetical protein
MRALLLLSSPELPMLSTRKLDLNLDEAAPLWERSPGK